MGHVVLNQRLDELPRGSLLLCEALDAPGVCHIDREQRRAEPMDSSLVALDELGAGIGSIVAVAEGREAAMPWWPEHRPVDSYCVAIIDTLHVKPELTSD
jgi:microcompartment protein CcmK/EutM